MAFLPHRRKDASRHVLGVAPWCLQHERRWLGPNGGEIAAAPIICATITYSDSSARRHPPAAPK
jgi:hypothetical protein